MRIYEKIKRRADELVHTAQEYTGGCVFKRNRHLVDHRGVCVALEAYTVKYACQKRMEVINLAVFEV